MRPLLESIQKTNQRYRLFQKGDGIVIGISGGPDSTALLLLLLKFQKKYALKITAVHLNHDLYPVECPIFEKFSEKLARELGVRFFKKKIDVKLLAKKNRRTVEEMGRFLRYEYFSQIAKKVGAYKIATAHTLDDQAETVLMRLARGSGLRGLAGIPVKRREGQREVIRPLAGVSKKEILQFLKKSGQEYCEDSTNKTDIYTRNKVRNKLIPWIEKNLNPRIRESLADLARISLETQDFLEGLSEKSLKRCLLRRGGRGVVLSVSRLNRLDPALRSETILAALKLVRGHRLNISASHIEAIRLILESSEDGLETHLSQSLRVAKKEGVLRIFDTPRK